MQTDEELEKEFKQHLLDSKLVSFDGKGYDDEVEKLWKLVTNLLSQQREQVRDEERQSIKDMMSDFEGINTKLEDKIGGWEWLKTKLK